MYPPWGAMAERRRIVTHHHRDIPPSVDALLHRLSVDARAVALANHLHRENLEALERLRLAWLNRQWRAAALADNEVCCNLEYICAVGGEYHAVCYSALRKYVRENPNTEVIRDLLQRADA
jgi:hypothetical protein